MTGWVYDVSYTDREENISLQINIYSMELTVCLRVYEPWGFTQGHPSFVSQWFYGDYQQKKMKCDSYVRDTRLT